MSVMMFIFGVIGMTTFGLVIVATIVQAVTLFMMTSTRVEVPPPEMISFTRPVDRGVDICDTCKVRNPHWSWCTSVEAVDERRAAKPRYTWISPEQRAVNLAEQKEADKKRAKVHTPDGITDIGDHWNCWLCDHPEEP